MTTSTASAKRAGSAASSVPTASTPPADAPITTASRFMSASAFLVQLLRAAQLFERRRMRREAQAFLRPQAEEAAPHERVAKEPDGAVLQRTVEVDEDVAAGHQ